MRGFIRKSLVATTLLLLLYTTGVGANRMVIGAEDFQFPQLGREIVEIVARNFYDGKRAGHWSHTYSYYADQRLP